jgi:hypothetical protein
LELDRLGGKLPKEGSHSNAERRVLKGFTESGDELLTARSPTAATAPNRGRILSLSCAIDAVRLVISCQALERGSAHQQIPAPRAMPLLRLKTMTY